MQRKTTEAVFEQMIEISTIEQKNLARELTGATPEDEINVVFTLLDHKAKLQLINTLTAQQLITIAKGPNSLAAIYAFLTLKNSHKKTVHVLHCLIECTDHWNTTVSDAAEEYLFQSYKIKRGTLVTLALEGTPYVSQFCFGQIFSGYLTSNDIYWLLNCLKSKNDHVVSIASAYLQTVSPARIPRDLLIEIINSGGVVAAEFALSIILKKKRSRAVICFLVECVGMKKGRVSETAASALKNGPARILLNDAARCCCFGKRISRLIAAFPAYSYDEQLEAIAILGEYSDISKVNEFLLDLVGKKGLEQAVCSALSEEAQSDEAFMPDEEKKPSIIPPATAQKLAKELGFTPRAVAISG